MLFYMYCSEWKSNVLYKSPCPLARQQIMCHFYSRTFIYIVDEVKFFALGVFFNSTADLLLPRGDKLYVSWNYPTGRREDYKSRSVALVPHITCHLQQLISHWYKCAKCFLPQTENHLQSLKWQLCPFAE